MGGPRVLLGDDHTMFSEGLCAILAPHFEVVGTARNGLELVDSVERLKPDVVIMDVSMPLLNGIGAAKRLQKLPTAPKIVFLTMHADVTFAKEAFRAGATGYVVKSSSGSEIVAAVQEALRGRTYVSPLIAGDLMGELIGNHKKAMPKEAELTARQKEILQLIAEGKSPKEIALVLNVSPRTVEFHKYRIMEAVGARTIAELTRYAVTHGIV